jgi:hypothetical protein
MVDDVYNEFYEFANLRWCVICFVSNVKTINSIFHLVCLFMIINLEVLKEEGDCEDGLNYFQTLEKKEWEVVELMEKCDVDRNYSDMDFLWKYVDVESFENAVEYYKSKGRNLDDAFEYCKDLPFFKDVMDKLGVRCL